MNCLGILRSRSTCGFAAPLAALGLLVAACAAQPPQPPGGPPAPIAAPDGRAPHPRGLHLGWQNDPTTTMTIQWLHPAGYLPLVEGHADTTPPFDLPHVGQVRIDGDVSDWWDRGLAVEFLAGQDHALRPPDLFDARVRLGWNEQGLLVAARVRDRVAVEHENPANLWQRDSLELFVSDGIGSENRYQVVVAPGRTEQHPQPRHNFHPAPGGPAVEQLSAEVGRQVTEDGYVLEVLLPWANLSDFQPRRGAEAALQIAINDSDQEGPRRTVYWFAGPPSAGPADAKYALRLSRQAGAPSSGRAVIRPEDPDEVTVYAPADLAGQQVRLLAGDSELSTARLEAGENRSRALLSLPEPPPGRWWGVLEVRLQDQPLATVLAPGRFHSVPAAELIYWPADAAEEQAVTVTMDALRVERWPGMYLQRVELTDLQPDTAYRFRAVGEQRDYGFRTMPAELTRPLRIALGGDTRHRQDWMENTNRAAMRYNPDFIVWGGDLAYADGREDRLDRWVEWFQANDNTLLDEQGNLTPIIVAIGNHEVQRGYLHQHEGYQQTDAWRLRIAPYFYQFFAFPGQPGYNVLDFGDYLSVIALDTAHTNPIDGEQLQWLERTLAERQNVPHLVPVYHVPGFPSHRPFDGTISARVREHWVPLFERLGVRVVFENHDHTYKRTHPIRGGEVNDDGIVYIGDGAWGVGTRSVHDPAETWYLHRAQSVRHAIIMTLDGPNRQFTVVSEDGEVIDEFSH